MKIKTSKAYALFCILFLSNQIITKTINEQDKNSNLEANNFLANQTQNNIIQAEKELKPLNKTNENTVINTNNSAIIPLNSTYNKNNYGMKHHEFEINFFSSFFRSFSLSLVSEVMDKTFIIILYFSTKLPPGKLLFFSGVSLVFMNSISIIIGYSIPFLLYRTLIEWIALISFVFLSFAYVNEAYHLEDETHEKKVTKTIKNERRSKMLERRTSMNNIRPCKNLLFFMHFVKF